MCVAREGGIHDGAAGSGPSTEVMGMRPCSVLKGVVACSKKVVRSDQ